MRKYTYAHFESLDDFLLEVDKTPARKRNSSEGHEGGSWSGSAKSVKAALALPVDGYEVELIEAEIGQIHSAPHKNMEPIFDVAGGDIEIGRYMSGEPECMLDFNMADSKTRFVHIVIGITEGSGTSNEQILHRAAAISSIIDDLENQKFRVRISAAIGNTNFGGGTGGNLSVIEIKDYWQHLPISSISGFLHTSFYRRAIFCYWEGHRKWNKPSGYGSVPSTDTMGEWLADNEESLDVDHLLYLPAISEYGRTDIPLSSFDSLEEAREYTTEVVKHIDALSS